MLPSAGSVRSIESFLEMAELDQHSSQPRHSVGLLLAFRPWVFFPWLLRQSSGGVQL